MNDLIVQFPVIRLCIRVPLYSRSRSLQLRFPHACAASLATQTRNSTDARYMTYTRCDGLQIDWNTMAQAELIGLHGYGHIFFDCRLFTAHVRCSVRCASLLRAVISSNGTVSMPCDREVAPAATGIDVESASRRSIAAGLTAGLVTMCI